MKVRDEALLKICNDIYNKHRTALRLIFENVNIDNSADSEIICNELQQLANSGKIIYGEGNRWSFSTQAMNEFLPTLLDSNSSWGTNYVYWYWFEKYDDALVIHFELGGWNLTDAHKKHMAALIDVSGKKQDDFRYKRLYYKKYKLSQDDYEDSLKKAVKYLIDNAIKNEEDLLAKAKDLLNQ